MTLCIIILSIIILLILLLLCGNYFFSVSLTRNADKSKVLGKVEKTTEDIKKEEENIKWISKHTESVYIKSTHGNLKLHGCFSKSLKSNNKWIILIHGYKSSSNSMAIIAQEFYNKSYNIILPDLRGHGKSEGNYVGMGYDERLDIIDWINYIVKIDKDAKIVIMGVSMGAATTLMTSGENLPQNVKCAVEDCSYTSAYDEFKYQMKTKYHMPAFPIIHLSNCICKMRAGYSFLKASPVKFVKKSKIPTLFIHGDMDTFVPFSMLDILYDSAACEKEKLVITGATHAESCVVDSEKYYSNIFKFIDKYMKDCEINDN